MATDLKYKIDGTQLEAGHSTSQTHAGTDATWGTRANVSELI